MNAACSKSCKSHLCLQHFSSTAFCHCYGESLACHAQLLRGYVTVVVDAAPIWQVVRLANALEEVHLLNRRRMQQLAHQ